MGVRLGCRSAVRCGATRRIARENSRTAHREGLMAISSDFTAFVIEQLVTLGRVTSRRMFGGAGLYCDELFFALIADDTLYFKVDDSNRADYLARGSKPFVPFPDKPEMSMHYYDVPADLLDDSEALSRWAKKSVAVALAAASKKTKSRVGMTKPKKASKKLPKKSRRKSPPSKPAKTVN